MRHPTAQFSDLSFAHSLCRQCHPVRTLNILYADVTQIYVSSLDFPLNSRLICLTSYLTLPSKHLKIIAYWTVILIFLSKPSSHTATLISINAYFIHPVAQIRNLGVILDSSFSHWISRKYPEYLTSTHTTKEQATLMCCPDYCYSLLNCFFPLSPLLSYNPFSQKQPGWFF